MGELFNGAFATWVRAKPRVAFGVVAVSPYLLAVDSYPDYDLSYQAAIGAVLCVLSLFLSSCWKKTQVLSALRSSTICLRLYPGFWAIQPPMKTTRLLPPLFSRETLYPIDQSIAIVNQSVAVRKRP